MTRTLLHLVDRDGRELTAETRNAVMDAYEWAVQEYPKLDRAAIAGWAEELAAAMASRSVVIEFPRRYAFAALHGKINAWFRKHPGTEITVGVGAELEQWAGLDRNAQITMERAVFFEQLGTMLSDRDRRILVLLLQDITSPRDVAAALGIEYRAAAKAIQRAKERMSAILSQRPLDDLEERPPHFCNFAG
jgi:hypothetical protein